jgi:hypothetical protein
LPAPHHGRGTPASAAVVHVHHGWLPGFWLRRL